MRRLRRILLNAATALSLLACVATAGLWVRSHRIGDQVLSIRDDRVLALFSCHGRVGIFRERADWVRRLAGHSPTWSSQTPPVRLDVLQTVHWDLLGLRVTSQATRDDRAFALSAALGWLLALTAPLPVWRATCAVRWKRRSVAAAGLCPACGYDLRATPDRCPECGRQPSS